MFQTVLLILQVRKWEKGLQQIFDETDGNVLSKTANECLQQYFKSLPKPGEWLVLMEVNVKKIKLESENWWWEYTEESISL